MRGDLQGSAPVIGHYMVANLIASGIPFETIFHMHSMHFIKFYRDSERYPLVSYAPKGDALDLHGIIKKVYRLIPKGRSSHVSPDQPLYPIHQ